MKSRRTQAIVVLLVLGTLAASAAPVHAGTRVGLMAGPLAARFANGSGDQRPLARAPATGWSGGGGLVVERPLAPNLAVLAGIEYAQAPDRARLAMTLDSGGGPVTTSALWDIRQHNLLLPVSLKWRRGPLHVAAGPQLRYLLSASRTTSDLRRDPASAAQPRPNRPRPAPAANIFEQAGTFDGDGDATVLYERWTLSAMASLGFTKPVGRHDLRAEVRAWTDVSRTTQHLGGGERATAFQLLLGAFW